MLNFNAKKIFIHFRSEYGAFWKCVTAGAIYMITQLAKMIFLATVFPVPLDEDDDDPNAEIPFDFLMVRTCNSFFKQFDFSPTTKIICLFGLFKRNFNFLDTN